LLQFIRVLVFKSKFNSIQKDSRVWSSELKDNLGFSFLAGLDTSETYMMYKVERTSLDNEKFVLTKS
jgi:hypothetical protein